MQALLFLFVFFFVDIGQLCGAEEEVNPSPPNPVQLKASWWDYYDVDPERLEIRIQKTDEIFQHLSMELPETVKEEAAPLMQQILVGLATYREMIKKPLILHAVEEHKHESYTFQDFLGLIQQLNQLGLMLETIHHQIKIEKTNLRSDQSYIDARLAAYLSSSKSDPVRVIKGLKIMVRKVAIEIDKRKIAELEIEKQHRQNAFEALKNELIVAQGRIDKRTIDIPLLQKEVETCQNLLNQHQDNLAYIQTQAANHLNLLASEQILFQTLKYAHTKVRCIEAKLELILGQVIIQPERKSVKELYKQLAVLEEERNLVDQELGDWKSAADLYYEISLNNGSQEVVKLAQDIGVIIQKVDQQHRYNGYLFDQCSEVIHLYYTSMSDRFTEYWESFVFKWRQYSTWAHKSMFKVGQTPITFYGLLKTLFLIVIAYFIAKFVRLWVNAIGKKQSRFKQAGIYSLGRISYYAIFIIGIIIAISSIGLDFTAFAVIAGALSVGIGFGLQSIVNNFVSGIILLLEKKLRVGDLIQLETGEVGRVIEVNVRTTLVRTFDNLEILVPNADFVSKRFTNWTLTDRIRRVRIPFSVAYGTDKGLVKQAATEAAKNVEMTLEDKVPQVWLNKFGESGLDFELVVWVNESLVSAPPMGTAAWYTWELETSFRRHGIEIPYPVRDVRLTKVP
ncbi:MAG: mechanosensitive ion channel [Chlamydiia bacterium]|nr:mechanosensitive ion channel [Chlamydiia bacterium]